MIRKSQIWKWTCIILALFFCFQACIDTIEIDLPESDGGRLVIEGSVERGPDAYVIRVSVRRTGQDIRDIVLKLEEADIFLIMNDEEVLPLINNEAQLIEIRSFHFRHGADPASANFRIRVRLKDGRVFESEDQKILDPAASSSLAVNMSERSLVNDAGILIQEDYVELSVNTALRNDLGEELSYLWEVSGVYEFREVAWTDDPGFFPSTCYVPVSSPPDEINVILASELSGDSLSNHKIAETEADFRFVTGYYYTVLQKTIDEKTAKYWNQVAVNISRDGTIFDPPAGQIEGNIRNINDEQDEVLGYFYVAGVDTLRYLTIPDETGNQRHPCAIEPRQPLCCDCLASLVNSTLIKPRYWD
ncbi:MAG: DUF4249 family protein [Bacteroidia bacterium]|nr:DUF4249 family protein [Bacteroidia bacterium]